MLSKFGCIVWESGYSASYEQQANGMNVGIVLVVIVALFFDFTNGFHDTANAIATVIATKAVPPRIAVIGASLLNFLGAFVSLKVAATVAKGIVTPNAITAHVILAGLIGAIIWNLITWRQGLPTSSSHALIGGVIGSSIAALGFNVVKWGGLKNKVLLPSLASPFLGLLLAALLIFIIVFITRKYAKEKVHNVFRRLQIFSGGFIAFTHGTNDAQKTMGIIALALLISHPDKAFHVPTWVIASSALAMAAGTFIGGWRIIHTLGQKITKLEPEQGFAAEMATGSMLALTAHFGFPVSTTHTISGSVVGVGAVNGREHINWKILGHIVVAWLITIPCAAVVGAGMELLLRTTHNVGVVVAIGILLGGTIYFTRNWTRETMAQLKNFSALFPIRSREK